MSDKPKRPVGRYHGGKWRLGPWVISHFPAHNVYVEPFGGMGSALMQKDPVRIEVFNDLDNRVVSLFRILRDPEKSEQLRRAVELTLFARAEHTDAWEKVDDEIESARRFIVVMFQSIGAKDILSRNGWRTRTSKAVWSPCVSWEGWPHEVPAMCRRLKDTIIECLPWQRILDIYDAPDALFFIDPPYLHSVRDAGHRTIYRHEMSDDDHRELCVRCRSLQGMALLSGYPNEIYRELLPDWRMVTKAARAQTNAPRTEALWISPSAAAAADQRQLMEVS